jgi:hypothetical protein
MRGRTHRPAPSSIGVTDARLFRLLCLSIGAAVATITLGVLAWSLTGSVGLWSDAAEPVVNLVALGGTRDRRQGGTAADRS